ncbi:sensor histidine kinase [Neobacillus sp. D3-1R]|uniref:sensor histidine kinase n=1 Tax=Neobacillus sp. D3-1R TaxID=3445778 RepID=UPI003F9FCA9A
MLTYTRLIMIFLLSFVYYKMIPEDNSQLKWFVLAAGVLFFLNHFLIFSAKLKKRVLIFLFVDILLSFTYGILFPGNTLYLIFLGVVSVTVFINISDKKLLQLCSAIGFVLWVLVEVYWWKVTGSPDLLDNMISVSFVVFGAVVGDLIRKLLAARETMNQQLEELHDSHNALSEAHTQLQSYSKQVEELTTIRERNRIAREIHDTVGHKMTALLVQLELSKALLKLDIEKSEETMVVCENLARDALQEIRLSVRTLHQEDEDQQPVIPAIRKLMADFYQTTQMESILELSGDPAIIPISLQPTIIRIVQESLTNAKRHGAATTYLLKMDCSEETLSIFIEDNGKGSLSIQPGFGLINMKERIEEHGGSVRFESVKGEGFRMNVHFPLLKRTWRTGGVR